MEVCKSLMLFVMKRNSHVYYTVLVSLHARTRIHTSVSGSNGAATSRMPWIYLAGCKTNQTQLFLSFFIIWTLSLDIFHHGKRPRTCVMYCTGCCIDADTMASCCVLAWLALRDAALDLIHALRAVSSLVFSSSMDLLSEAGYCWTATRHRTAVPMSNPAMAGCRYACSCSCQKISTKKSKNEQYITTGWSVCKNDTYRSKGHRCRASSLRMSLGWLKWDALLRQTFTKECGCLIWFLCPCRCCSGPTKAKGTATMPSAQVLERR